MNTAAALFAQDYGEILSRHLSRPRRGPATAAALQLGRRAMAAEIDTLDLAKIHERVLPVFLPAEQGRRHARLARRASAFFADVITPIEKSHRTARESAARLRRMMGALDARSRELVGANRQLRREIAERRTAERSLRKSEHRSRHLLIQSQHMQRRLRVLSRQLLRAQEDERKRISRDLHDIIGQTLASINVQLAALKSGTATAGRDFEQDISRAEELVNQSVEVVHRFARELRPAVLDDLGLIPALQTFMTEFKAQTGMEVSLTASASVERLSSPKLTVLFRVAQEALTNIGRHAKASRMEVNIQSRNRDVLMTITDNGTGFEPARLEKRARLGIMGMRERLEMVGGRLTLISAPGQGTTVRALIPAPRVKAKPQT
jgi:signal transduction histidine kinase